MVIRQISKRYYAGALLITAGVLFAGTDRPVDKEESLVASRRGYWAFKTPVRPATPAVNSDWARTPIDAFILSALEAKKLAPSPAAGRAQLLRRVTLDLTGLPPTPEEVAAFLRDNSADAYEKVVDRLLASSHYGERWALRWLDVVRYADTNGFETDAVRPQAWRYRDYVTHAFNNDKPYDRFLREQIAGDELWSGDREAVIASGFNRLGPAHIVGGVQDQELNRQEQLTEMAGAIGPVYLGLTVGCARCHNHKFDPILQADYYRLQAIYAGTQFKEIEIATPDQKLAYEQAKKAYEASLKPLKDQIAAIEAPFREALRKEKTARLDPKLRAALEIPKEQRNAEQKLLAKDAEDQVKSTWDEVLAAMPPAERDRRAVIRKQFVALELTAPDPSPAAYAVANMEKEVPPTHILQVGDYKHKLGVVEPGFLKVLVHNDTAVPAAAAGRRSSLANWLADPRHPLTARVMVNRIWQFRMGTGLVATPNDFGVLGQRPTNQKLLDWLAVEFVEKGWSVKTMDRMIVLSSVYRQGTHGNAASAQIDPDNKLYWRMNRRRLEGEIIRDNVLAVAGTLNPKQGGKPVFVPIEKEVYDLIFSEGEPDNLWPVTPDPAEHTRRSLYLLNKRSVRLPLLANFDQPDTMTSCPVRPVSTHSLQSLSLFNSDFMNRQAEAFAARLRRESGGNASRQVRRAFQLSLARDPSPAELKLAKSFLLHAPLSDFCLTLLNRNEFVYVP
ncbi:MAG TPA: DUF1549 and DUF1553 domain-containing protein [Bryobacteraceae bacterium]|nr:DUF1549 and DUF1553 domain-containing protein [Bryobacteraceae bacterium]